MHFLNCFKGSVSQDSLPSFFHDSNPSRPQINRLTYLRIQFWFRWDIQIFTKLHGVRLSRSQTPWCASSQGVRLCCVLPNVESNSQCASHCGVKWSQFFKKSLMCIPLRSWTLWCASSHRVRLCGVHHTTESSSAVCILPRSQAV